MTDLNKLSPPALSAAMRGGTEKWGRWGSVEHHTLYVEKSPAPSRRLRMCRCGCGKRARYNVMANGMAMGHGCEIEAHRKKKWMSAMGAARASVEAKPR